MNKISEFLQGPAGEWSSKRLIAIASFGVAIGLAFVGRDITVVGAFLGVTTIVLGIGAATRS